MSGTNRTEPSIGQYWLSRVKVLHGRGRVPSYIFIFSSRALSHCAMPSKGHSQACLSVYPCLLLPPLVPKGILLPVFGSHSLSHSPGSCFLCTLHLALLSTSPESPFLLRLSPPSASLWTCAAWAWLPCSDMYPSSPLPLITSTLLSPPVTLLFIVNFIFLNLNHTWHRRESCLQLLRHVWMDKHIVMFKLRCSWSVDQLRRC